MSYMRLIKRAIMPAFVLIMLLIPVSVSASSPFQNATKQACEGLNAVTDGCDKTAASDRADSTIKTVINILSLIVGFVSVVMVIIGGFKYVVSNGDSNGISSAKNTIIYAIVGLIIVALAQVLVQLAVAKVKTQ